MREAPGPVFSATGYYGWCPKEGEVIILDDDDTCPILFPPKRNRPWHRWLRRRLFGRRVSATGYAVGWSMEVVTMRGVG